MHVKFITHILVNIPTIIVDEDTLPADILRPEFNDDDSDDSEVECLMNPLSRKALWIRCFPTQLERPPDKLANNC